MNAADFVTLYQYNSWANHRVLNSVEQVTADEFTREIQGSFSSLRDTLVHIAGAEDIWLSRWKGLPTPTFFQAKDFPTLAVLRERWQTVENAVSEFVRNLNDEDIHQVFSYHNLKGEPYSIPLGQAMQHVANHSTYHRGQITTLLRQLGHTPQSTDLLYFYLERNASSATA